MERSQLSGTNASMTKEEQNATKVEIEIPEDKTNLIKEVWKKKEKSLMFMSIRDKERALKQWEKIIAKIKEVPGCMRAWKIAEKIIGEVFLEYRDFESAIPHFESLKNLCEQQEKKDYKRKLEAYKQLGFCH